MKASFVFVYILFFSLFSFSTSHALSESSGIEGLWKGMDQNSERVQCLVAVYKYQDKYYGKMIATYDKNGNVEDTILEQKEKTEGVVGNPPYCGLDFIYNVATGEENLGEKTRYKGKIVDPKRGKVYTAELWRQSEELVVRGELWIFGKNIYWPRATEKDLPKGFTMNDIKKFVPIVPKVK